jgi:hypothetical protein
MERSEDRGVEGMFASLAELTTEMAHFPLEKRRTETIVNPRGS